MVKQLSHNMAGYISRQLNYDKNKEAVLSYGLEIIIGEFFKIVIILGTALVLRTFSFTLIALVSFSSHRRIIGGAHEKSYLGCFIISITLLLLVGVIGKNFQTIMQEHIWPALFVYGQSLILTYLWVPAGTEKKEIKNTNTRRKIKRTSLVISTLWILLIVYSFINQVYHQYILASTLGVFSAFFFVTPLAYKIAKSNYKLLRG